jgi:hypothetical protein
MSDPTPTPRVSSFDGQPCGCRHDQRCIDCATDTELTQALDDGRIPLQDLGTPPTGPTPTPTRPNHLDRVYTKYGHEKPYTDQDTLQQKLWSVVDREVGPNEADLVTAKLVQAVEEHIAKAGVRR